MIKTEVLEKFQENNKEFDIMGVVRTLYPKADVTIPSTKPKKAKKK